MVEMHPVEEETMAPSTQTSRIPVSSLPSRPNFLDHNQIMDLLHNCLKLASENKINRKNTWELNLIDHLSEIIQSKPEKDDAENNFQKASYTLEAGVKIYSLRVDSLYSEAYKVLEGINRVVLEEECETAAEVNHAHVRTEQKGLYRKDIEREMSPLSTLETSFEALNAKKFDVVFSVDPLYHQTSAQFDEGGAKGLLLNNLGVYGSCCVLFDSFEVPEKFILSGTQNDKSELIDLSFSKEHLDLMMINMHKKDDIAPTLRDIMSRFGENNSRPQNVLCAEEQPVDHGKTGNSYHPELEDNSLGDFDPQSFDHDDLTSVVDDNSTIADSSFFSDPEEIGDYSFQGFDASITIEKIVDFLSFGLGFTSKTNAWAGPNYWKFKKSEDLEQVLVSGEKHELATNRAEVKKPTSDIDFTMSVEKKFSNIFEPAKNPKSLLFPTNRAPCKFTLPEDCHYKPESLAKLFLLPDVMFFGKKARILHDALGDPSDDFAPASLDRKSINDDHYDDGNSNGDVDDLGSLVRLPRQFNKVDVQYDKVSKQVDVHAVKETLWMHIHETVEKFGTQEREASVSLRQVMHRLQDDSSADSQKDISVQLFFICLLHLANEHGLILHHQPTLNDVAIDIPKSAFKK